MTAMLSESLEDYLEAIYLITGTKGAARVKDVATHLNVASASVNNALQGLSARGLIEHTPYDLIQLTAKGRDVAKKVLDKHGTLKTFLEDVLLVGKEEAEDSACRMEHAISDVVMMRIAFLNDYIKNQIGCNQSFAKTFSDFCGIPQEQKCIEAEMTDPKCSDCPRSNQ
jgi:DtxR family Mn-dependent transcriptional regulator